jgi:type IV pilus assembly protein PilC
MPRQPSKLELQLNDWVDLHLRRIPFIQKTFFVEHLHTMIHAGLSLVEAMDVLGKEIENKKMRIISQKIKADVEKGQPLSEALAKHPSAFPSIYTRMIAAGEVAGKLEEALKQIATQMHKTHELTSSIRSAMIYPAVIIIALGGIGVMMVTVVLPKIVVLFEEFKTELPLATRILISISNVLSKPANLIIILSSLALLVAAFVVSLKKMPGFRYFIHKINLHLPIAGKIIKKINLARFSLTLSSLLKSTIPIVEAVEITASTCTNMLYQKELRDAAQKIKTGVPLSEILSQNYKLFPPMVTEMIMVGEKSGEVNQLLDELSNFYSTEVDKTMKNFATVIEPVIIILLGLAVAGMAVAVLMPMYTLVQNF